MQATKALAVTEQETAAVSDAEIIRLYKDEGLSMQGVADKTGASFGRVRGVVEREGISRPRRKVSGEKAAAIVAACTAGGRTQIEVATMSRIDRRTVAYVLRKLGALPQPDADLLPSAAAAALAGISQNELASLARNGTLAYVRGTPRGNRLYVRAGLEAVAARRADGITLDGEQLIQALRWMWAGVYKISTSAGGGLEAWRLDGSGSVLAATPEELRDALRDDYPKYAAGAAL